MIPQVTQTTTKDLIKVDTGGHIEGVVYDKRVGVQRERFLKEMQAGADTGDYFVDFVTPTHLQSISHILIYLGSGF